MMNQRFGTWYSGCSTHTDLVHSVHGEMFTTVGAGRLVSESDLDAR